MILKGEMIKSVLCVILCVSLLILTVSNGDSFGLLTDKLYSKLSDSSTAVNENSSVVNDTVEDENTIVGFGGGGYESAQVNTAPTDIETLKAQAAELYKNYKKTGSIEEKQMSATAKTLKYGNILLDNKTDNKIGIKSYLNKTPQYKTITKDKPYILIYHSHTTEGYEMLDLGWYSDSYNSRTTDKSKNMVRVGDALTSALEKQGFKVIHDRNIYDTSYTGAYPRSRKSVESYLKKYPSIQITLDVHRDAIHYDNKVRAKPTALINGKKAAQVMIITGCEGEGVESFSSWKQNLAFSLNLQSSIEKSYNGLMRPVYFSHRKYNMDLTPCSVLLEFGTDANTLEEAVYSAELVGESLGKLLNAEMKK